MRNDHAEFETDLKHFKHNVEINGLSYSDSYLLAILFNLEKRIRELEFRINNK